VSVCREGPNVLIQVRDDGSGIDDRDLPRIFERFYKADNSRRTVGSGLGLALVKHTAEALGGSVTVESQLGRGSKFTISLPSTDRIPSEAAGARGDT
jgi:signal transduction histidine kinase